MPTPDNPRLIYGGSGHAPFALQSSIVYFHDWRYVNHGEYAWGDAQRQTPPTWVLDPLPPLHLEHRDLPGGIRLVAQPARKTEPVLTAEQAGEPFILGAGTLIHDQGRYRLWYEGWPMERGLQSMGAFYNLVRYAESDNGADWTLPSLGMIEYQGRRDHNIVYGEPFTPVSRYHGGSVFVDPSAPPQERYKMFHLGLVPPDALEKYRQRYPQDVDPFLSEQGLYGGVSPDGLRWTPIPEPILVQQSDTQNVCTYDPLTRKYIAYVRRWYFNRRAIGRTQSDDFRHFPLSEPLFWPNAMNDPHDLWYANAKTIMPGAVDYHLMFPLRWRILDDRMDFHLATSPDGMVWGFVPGGPVCEPGDPGAWDAGVVGPGLGLVELPDERMGILFAGSPVPHKHPRRPPMGALAWATWRKGRLVALRADAEGSFALWPLTFQGRTARLNFRTSPGGFIKVEAVGPDFAALPGRAFDDCDWLTGDHLDRPVTWRGEADLGHAEGAPVMLRFRLRCADLYSVSFR